MKFEIEEAFSEYSQLFSGIVLHLRTLRSLPSGRYCSEENKHLTMYYISIDNK